MARDRALLLRIHRGDTSPEEIYVARKLCIGRAVDNPIVIDHPDVDRHHAEVEQDPSGQYVLRCLDKATIQVDGQPRRELVLTPGACFQIADTRFECREAPTPARPGVDPAAVGLAARCPHCGGEQFPDPAP